MEILVDKVRYEQEIRILKEKDHQKDEEIKIIKDQNKLLLERMEKLEKTQARQDKINPVVNFIDNRTTINNIQINSYHAPNYKFLELGGRYTKTKFGDIFKEYGLETPLRLVKCVWFNPEHPENLSMYMADEKTRKMITFNGMEWTEEKFDASGRSIRDRAYTTTDTLIGISGLTSERDKDIIEKISNSRNNEAQILCDLEDIFTIIKENSKMIQDQVICDHKCQK